MENVIFCNLRQGIAMQGEKGRAKMLIEGILTVLLCPEFKMILPVACFTAVYPHAKC